MKKIIVLYDSWHHHNTEKLLQGCGEKCQGKVTVDLYPLHDDNAVPDLSSYDAIGFASGVYAGRMSEKILAYIKENQTALTDRSILFFSTSGFANTKAMKNAARMIPDSTVKGMFACPGWNTFGPFKLIGGTSKNHPNETDMQKAADFVIEAMK